MLNKKVIMMLPSLLCMAARLSYHRGICLVAVTMILVFTTGTAQEATFAPSREIASGLYDSGNYSEALRHYAALSEAFPADPVYKYYSGVCMVMTGMDPKISSELLLSARAASSQLRPVPGDALYYLGRSYQQSGKFGDAISYYERYMENASKKEIRKLEVERYINECSEGKGSIIGLTATDQGIKVKIDEEIEGEGVINPDEVVENKEVTVAKRDSVINPDYDAMAREALLYQFRADSVTRLADRYRARLKELSGNERTTVEQKILQLEQLGFEYQAEADRKFALVAGVEGITLPDKPLFGDNAGNENITGDNKVNVGEESGGVSGEANGIIIAESTINEEDSIPGPVITPPVLSFFSDEFQSDSGIEVNPKLPGGLVYRIQVAAFRNAVKEELFKSLGPVYGIKADNSDITYYFIGLFRSKADADRALGRVRNKGFSDAFVIAVLDGSRISLERAASLEPEWKDKTLAEKDGFVQGLEDEDEPAEPQTLVYRIEVKKVKKPLKEEEVNNYRRVAGNRPFDIIETPDKNIVYLIGKFITFESAATYSDLLYRNGIKESRVVAYLGNREIPLDKAKELFELYFNKQEMRP